MFRKSIATLFLFAILNATTHAATTNLDDVINDIRHRSAEINYRTPDAEKQVAFGTLIANANQASESFPNRAEPLIWKAIVLASAAKIEGGLGALSKVKEARDDLLIAEKINPNALNGSI